jgi:hypothetical protein
MDGAKAQQARAIARALAFFFFLDINLGQKLRFFFLNYLYIDTCEILSKLYNFSGSATIVNFSKSISFCKSSKTAI